MVTETEWFYRYEYKRDEFAAKYLGEGWQKCLCGPFETEEEATKAAPYGREDARNVEIYSEEQEYEFEKSEDFGVDAAKEIFRDSEARLADIDKASNEMQIYFRGKWRGVCRTGSVRQRVHMLLT